ncbi:MAG: flagellin [Pseudomonadota bacterium]
MPSPISSSVISTVLSPTITDMRSRLEAASKESVTGERENVTQYLEGRIGKAMVAQKALDDLTIQRDQLSLRATRLEIAQTQLEFVQTASSGLAVEINTAISSEDTRAQSLVASNAETSLEQIFASLNARHGERFLFSGDATATNPLGDLDTLLEDVRQIAINAPDDATFATDLDTYFNDPAGGWHQTIYQGSDNISDPDAVGANDPAIRQLIQGLTVVAIAQPDSGIPLLDASTEPLLAASYDILSGETGITNLRAELGLIQEQVERATDTLDVEQTILTQAFSTLTARDQYEAATEVKLLEANLQAAYLLTSRLSDLSLLNYLR